MTTLPPATPMVEGAVNYCRGCEIRVNRNDRSHTGTLIGPAGSAIITELK